MQIIDLYAKKIGQDGAVYLCSLPAPDSLGDEFLVPVRSIPKVEGDANAQPVSGACARVFRYMPNPLQKIFGDNKAYVEV